MSESWGFYENMLSYLSDSQVIASSIDGNIVNICKLVAEVGIVSALKESLRSITYVDTLKVAEMISQVSPR